ncbi:MAG: DUF429 domain-containing protein [Stappiaceae bacterium]
MVESVTVAGVDGCRAGWIAVFWQIGDPTGSKSRVFSTFSSLLDAEEAPQIIAVDMPIGLPEKVGAGGRGPERAVRPLLDQRQSSVFSVPSRRAVYCESYSQSCAVAYETSDPPRKVSKQCFNLFPKIREIDRLMSASLEARVYEVHPELAFWRLNDETPMSLPKKVKSRPSEPGLSERQACLEKCGFSREFFEMPRPKGVGADDLLDASANSLIAARLHSGQARSFPSTFERDSRGLRIAMWA